MRPELTKEYSRTGSPCQTKRAARSGAYPVENEGLAGLPRGPARSR